MRILVFAALTLAGCAGAVAERIGPKMYEVDCRRSRGNCWREAARVCPDGFDELDGADHSGYLVKDGVVMPVYKSEMIIRCRGRERPEEPEMEF